MSSLKQEHKVDLMATNVTKFYKEPEKYLYLYLYLYCGQNFILASILLSFTFGYDNLWS